MNNNSISEIIRSGVVTNNPVFVQILGLCPLLAVTTSVENGIGMGLSVIAVLMTTNALVSILRRLIPGSIRIAAFVVLIACVVGIIEMLLKAFFPDLAESLGLFIPLIAVNCIILGRAEAFASKNKVGSSIADAFGIGAGFTIALVILSAVREILGNGTFLNISLFPEGFLPATLFILPAGAFLVVGVLIAIFQYIITRQKGGKSK